MENLKFEPKHNLVACLDESIPETDGYRDMIKFIKRTKYVYAMCAKPAIYARLIKSFWRTAEVIRDDNGVAVVRGNITRDMVLTVSEEAIRNALRIDEDEVGMNDELTMAECQSCFVNMGHPPIFPKSQFYRAKLGKKFKLLCYVVQQCMSRRSAGFDNFPSDIASPIVAIAENKPFNMSRWIMNGFVFNLVKGKRFKFLMYPRLLQLMINVAYPIIRTEGYSGGILYTEDMNDLSYRKMSIGNVPSMDLFDYMRDIANNEEDIEGIYHLISHGEIVNPQDLVDEVPDNLLDDDEYFARHPEDENESENEEEDDSDDGDNDDDDGDKEDSDSEDGNDDGGVDAESDSEVGEIIETTEPMELETENVEVIEQVVIEEPVEVVSVEKEVAVEVAKPITKQYVRSRRSKSVVEKMLSEPEEINVVQIAQEVIAEAETIAQIVEEADAGVTDPIPVDIPTTSSQVAEEIEQGLESSPNFVSSVEENEDKKRIVELEEMVTKLVEANELLKASNERKKKRFEEFWDIHNQNLKTFKELDADHLKLKIEHDDLKDKYDRLKEEHENLKYDYKELKAECNTLEDEKEMLEKWLEETKPKKSGSTSNKDFSDEVVEMTEATQTPKVYLTRARGTTNVGIRVESPIIIPDEAVAETVTYDKAEGKRKLDAVPEIMGDEGSSKKARIDETVQIEPIQSVAEVETETVDLAKVDEIVTGTKDDKTVQIETIQPEAVIVEEMPESVEVMENVPESVEVIENVPENVVEEASQFEPVQTDNAPMIEALDDLDDIDFTESENEAEPETNVDQEIPDDLDQRFAYLEKMKYNAVFLNGLNVSQINEEYEKCMIAQDKAEADKKEFIIEMGEWTPLQESLNIEELPPTELYHQNPEEMSSREMRDWLSSRNYPYRTLKRLKSESLRKIVVSFMKTEKMYNQLPVMAPPENAHKKRHELMDMFPSEVKSYNIPMDVRESWHKSATAGDVVRSLLSKGQSIAELLDSMIVPEKNKKVKIIAWKYDEVFDAFMIKRVNGLCDVYHYYSSIFKLEVQDLKELHKLRLINHTHAERGDKCAMLLDAGIARPPKYLDFRGQQEDTAYVQAKKERKKKRLIVSEDMYLEEFSDEYFDKVTNPGLKVIDGSQMTKPILRVFYNQEPFELKLVRNLEDWDKDMITLFSTFELKLLHPSYIDYLRSCRMEKCKDKLAEADRKLFVVMIEVIAAATEKIRVRKALLNSNLVRVDIPEIEFMRVSGRGTLEVQVKGQEMPFEFYANIDFAGLNLDSLRRMNACPILTNESKPRQAKIAEKFKSCIEEALKEQEEYKGRELLNIKEEPEDWWSDPHMEPSMFVVDEVVRVFDCMLLEDFSVVKFKASVVPPGVNGVVLRTKACRHYLGDVYESVLCGSSSKTVVKPSVSVRRSSRKQLTLHAPSKETPQASGLQGFSSSDPVDVDDYNFVASLIGIDPLVKVEGVKDVVPTVEMDPLLEISGSVVEGATEVGELPSVKKGGTGLLKKFSAKVKGKAVEDSSSVPIDQDPDVDDLYIPDWQVGVHDTFSKASVCREAIHGFAPPAERARNDCLENVELLKKFFTNGARAGVDKISSERAESIRKLTLEKEDLTTKLSTLQFQVASDREEFEAGRKELEAWRKELELKAEELKSRKAAATRAMEENKRLEETNKWLVEEGFKQVVTYLLNSAEFKEPLSMIYMKALAYGRHQGLLSGYANCLKGVTKEACKEYKPDAAGEFANSVKVLEITSYPFLQALSGCSGQPLSFIQSLEPNGLSKKVADRVLGKKRPAPTLLSQDQADLPAVSLKRLKVAEKNVDEVLKDLGTPSTPAADLASEDLTPVKSSSEATPSDADSPEDVAAPGFPAPGDSLNPSDFMICCFVVLKKMLFIRIRPYVGL
ncbi:hypothetical protein QVD17_06896 [Tagetes erecta]|uniref:Uncharacterized protein n=1 Tax=Tagetes erecta TaxID=13708 RepID=A0AAD8LF33_TARER|nr:hypothetical protein QVD17_06896 [Tagetes erecta]